MENATSSKATNLEQILQQTGLNEDCLVNIFKCLSGCDLVTLCDLDYENDTSLTDLINDRVISSLKIYDFGRLPASHVFRYFGRSLQRFKLRIQTEASSDFLENVIRYCQAPGRLREAILAVDTDCPGFNFDDDLWDQVQPFFQNLEKLNIDNKNDDMLFPSEFFGQLDFPNLKVLTLKHFYENKTWMEFLPNPQTCANITELWLIDIWLMEEKMIDFKKFLDRLPNLEVFVHTRGKLGIVPVAEELHRRFPNLRGFGYSIKGETRLIAIDEHLRISGLEKFTNLTEFHLQISQCRNLHSLFRFVPNIKVLGMWQVDTLLHAPVEVRRIVESIRQTIADRSDRSPANDHVHLLVNRAQYNDFNVLKNICNIIRLTVHETTLQLRG